MLVDLLQNKQAAMDVKIGYQMLFLRLNVLWT